MVVNGQFRAPHTTRGKNGCRGHHFIEGLEGVTTDLGSVEEG